MLLGICYLLLGVSLTGECSAREPALSLTNGDEVPSHILPPLKTNFLGTPHYPCLERGPGACPELAEGVRSIKTPFSLKKLNITLKTNPKATHARFVSLKKFLPLSPP
jgi:hypothetical protein